MSTHPFRMKHLSMVCLTALALLMPWAKADAQKYGVKTNLLYDATANASLGFETAVGKKWTAELAASTNLWKFSEGKQWRNYFIQPELRYWFCTRFNGHFVGVHVHGGQFNIGNTDMNFKFLGTDFSKLRDNRAQGWFAGAGVSYGYDWILSKHWNLEAEIGIGYSYTRYDLYPCAVCGTKLADNRSHNYYGITRAAISIMYLF